MLSIIQDTTHILYTTKLIAHKIVCKSKRQLMHNCVNSLSTQKQLNCKKDSAVKNGQCEKSVPVSSFVEY